MIDLLLVMEYGEIMKTTNVYVTIYFLVLLLMSACSQVPANTKTTSTLEPSPTFEPQPAMGSASYRGAHNLKELVGESNIIVVGQFSAAKEVINTARNVNDINKPDPHVLEVGQVYQFEITRYLKGGGPKTIFVVQPEGFLVGDQVGLNADTTNIKKARSIYKYIPAGIGKAYILFLSPLQGFPDLKNYYNGAIHPWRFDISNPDLAVPESVWDEALNYFPTRKVSKLLDQIANPDLDPTPAYPYP